MAKRGYLPEYSLWRGIIKFIFITTIIGLVIAGLSFAMAKFLGRPFGLDLGSKSTEISANYFPQITTPLFGDLSQGIPEDYLLYAEGDDAVLIELLQKESSIASLLREMTVQKEASAAHVSVVFADPQGVGMLCREFNKDQWNKMQALLGTGPTLMDGWYYAVQDGVFVVASHQEVIDRVVNTFRKQLIGLDLTPEYSAAKKILPQQGTLLLSLPYHGKTLPQQTEVESALRVREIIPAGTYFVFTQNERKLIIEGK